MLVRITLILQITILVVSGCSKDHNLRFDFNFSSYGNKQPVSHQLYDNLLQKYVSGDGKVNYKGLLQDSLQLNQYLELFSNNPPNKSWSQNQKLAYWINAYNAFTLQLVMRHYPVKSIKDIGSSIQIPFVNSCWDIPFIRIANKQLTLNEIEHQILRKNFTEPRIHFAIVCASVSCPKLRREAYTATKLHAQLNDQAKMFINDLARNKLQPDKVKISKIFNWFKSDFTRTGTLIQYLNHYSKIKIQPNAQVSTLNYNWNLNE